MKAATAVTPSEPVVTSTPVTSVTCRPDQSMAVPSPSPNATAIRPSR